MKKALSVVLLASGFGVITLLAADFWHKKKYTEWDTREAQKILSDSPWAHSVDIFVSGRAGTGDMDRGRTGGGGPDSTGVTGAESSSMGGGGGGGGGGGRGRGRGGASDDNGGGMEPGGGAVRPVHVVLRFHTALPLKQAVARLRYGNEVANSPEAAKNLARQETRYVVGVAGLRRIPDDPKTLKEKAFLKPKGKPPIPASEVVVDSGGLFLVFPREGNPITVDDGEVEVQLKLTAMTIKSSFKLKDMVYDGKLEL